MEIAIHQKKTHADRYVQYISEHPMPMKRDVVRGLVLRAYRILSNYPRQLKNELRHLRIVLQNKNNGYPSNTIDRWFMEFKREFQRKPHLLVVKSHLCPEEMFRDRKQQIFKLPEPKDRFPNSNLTTEDISTDNEEQEILENVLQKT